MRKLALATLVATFVLILVGGVVRVSDSGLGCGPAGSGFHGWPFCNGDVVPGVDLNSIVEYTHRVLAIVVGFMMLALVVLAWRRYREYRLVTGALLVLVAAQGAARRAHRRGEPRGGLRRRPSRARDAAARPPALPVALDARRRAGGRRAADPRARDRRDRARLLHDRRRRLHGRHAELRPRRLPARPGRPPRLRQAVPHLQRRVHAVRQRRSSSTSTSPTGPSCTSPRSS